MSLYVDFLTSSGPGERAADCPLCQEPIAKGTPSITHNDGSCRHTFCKSCFDSWVRYAPTIPPTCPICRAAIIATNLSTRSRHDIRTSASLPVPISQDANFVSAAAPQVHTGPQSTAPLNRFERLYGTGHFLGNARGPQSRQAGRTLHEVHTDRMQARLDSALNFGELSVAELRQILGWQDGYGFVAVEHRTN